MTPYSALVKRIRRETVDIDRAVARVQKSWERSKTVAVDQDIYLVENLHPLWIRVRMELLAFADFLALLDSEIEG